MRSTAPSGTEAGSGLVSPGLAGSVAARNPRVWETLHAPVYLISLLPGLSVWTWSGLRAETLVPLALATFGVLLLQHGINVTNDVTDWRRRADVRKAASWVRLHEGREDLAFAHGVVAWCLGSILGLFALFQAGRLWVLLWAVPLALLGWLYNSGRRPLSYTPFGESVTAVCYGPGVTGGLWFTATASFEMPALWGSLSYGCLAAAVLLSHQPAQLQDDVRAGKRSFAVRYGACRTRLWARVLSAAALAGLSAAALTAPLSAGAQAVAVASATLVWTFIARTPSPTSILAAAGTHVILTLAVATLAMLRAR